MLRSIFKGLVDIVYPKTCIACKNKLNEKTNIDNLVCAECWEKIKRNLPPFCHCCGRHLEKENITKYICPNCIRNKFHFDRAFSPCLYEGVIKDLICEFKYKNKDYLGTTLSRPLVEFIEEYDLPIDYVDFIIPVPLHKTKLREREFNQAEILARQIAGRFNKKMLPDLLIRHRATKTQTDLEEKKRFLNVQGSFSVKEGASLKGKNILLVDDVLTTAATSSEAAYTLKDKGANIVFVLTLAN